MRNINKSYYSKAHRLVRLISLLVIISTLTGCLYWLRAFQTYQQLDEFDKNFGIEVADEFLLSFKKPIMFSEDFISLSGLRSSEVDQEDNGKRWRYWFHKVDKNNKLIEPEIKFYFDLHFNSLDRLYSWGFSSLFLQIAPPQFLEVSLRSLAGAEINKETRQLRANTDHIDKISADLPKKSNVVKQLGTPLEIIDDKENEIYVYHFLLDSLGINKGYEDRALSVIKLTFDKSTDELIKMSGRFAGLKISISYRKYLENVAVNS
ncbi:MAG: hypothetical protein KGZ88_17190 [Methylomicrobium sp.]|nr:hypothetical protein [Methylomicrobium sp.]